MILNLDPQFIPLPSLASIPYESFVFPGGEPHIRIGLDMTLASEVYVGHRIRSFQDMGLFALATDALRRAGVKTIKAVVPYFPAARQDRVASPGESLTVKVYADMFNQMHLDEIHIYDPHSDVTPALLNQCHTHSNHLFIEHVIQTLPSSLLIAPDGGALKKIYALAAYLKGYEVVECSKSRDVISGKISGFRVNAEDLNGQNCLMVDDICDGGRTFIGLAEALKAKNAGNLYLAVSHGIFSRGLDELTQHFEHIYSTDSFQSLPKHPKLTQIRLADRLFDPGSGIPII